jgi:hypothetical protein
VAEPDPFTEQQTVAVQVAPRNGGALTLVDERSRS